MIFKNFEDVLNNLSKRLFKKRISPRIFPVSMVLTLLGNPHLTYPVIHIAGTNGKTSTAKFIENGLRFFGFKTGLYISPHIFKINERISINGYPVNNRIIVEAWNIAYKYIFFVDNELNNNNQHQLTYFECITILAFLIFSKQSVDVSVIEVGLGGKFDATNVVNSEISVLTTINLDHTEILGHSVEDIANEKIGIIKPKCCVISGIQKSTVLKKIKQHSKAVKSLCFLLNKKHNTSNNIVCFKFNNNNPFFWYEQKFDFNGIHGYYKNIHISNFGNFQIENAAIALCAIEVFLNRRNLNLINKYNYKYLFLGTKILGRMEIFRIKNSIIFLDSAHNPNGIQKSLISIQKILNLIDNILNHQNIIIIFGCLKTKNAKNMLYEIKKKFNNLRFKIYLITLNKQNAFDSNLLSKISLELKFPKIFVYKMFSLDEILSYIFKYYKNSVVIIFGSTRIVFKAKKIFKKFNSMFQY